MAEGEEQKEERARYSSIPEIRKEKHNMTIRQMVSLIRNKANVSSNRSISISVSYSAVIETSGLSLMLL
jgi:hypothetical protein